MNDYVIINTVSAYPEVPVPFEILKNNMSQFVDKVSNIKVDKKYLIVDKNNNKIKELLKEEAGILSDINMEVIETDVKDGFVYSNATAVLKIIEDEKPIPSDIDKNLPVYSVEELLDFEEKTVFVDGDVSKKGLFTFNKETSVREIVSQCASEDKFKGIYFGHPMGHLMGKEQFDEKIELNTDYIYIFDEGNCALDRLKDIVSRYEKETCGRCVFGYEGVTQINMILTDMIQKKGKPADIELLLNLGKFMYKQSLCEVGMSVANTLLTALENFRTEIEEHITKKVCNAAVCQNFITYHVLPKLCTGCNECQEHCKYDAILGKKNFIHVIEQKECVQCGECLNICPEGAIVKAGVVKPKGPKRPIPRKKI